MKSLTSQNRLYSFESAPDTSAPYSADRVPPLAGLFLMLIGSLCFGCQSEPPPLRPTTAQVERSADCIISAYFVADLCPDEKELLDAAHSYRPELTAEALDAEILRRIAEERSIDFATAVFYTRVVAEESNRAFYEFVARRSAAYEEERRPLPDYSDRRVMLALAPGMFYQDNPEIGADGRQLRALASRIGLVPALIPSRQTGTTRENAKIICRFVADIPGTMDVILASASKGGADVMEAIQHCGNEAAFQRVIGWYNLGGMHGGTFGVNIIEETPELYCKTRAYFCLSGYDFDGLLSLRREDDNPAPSQAERVPHIRFVNVIATPLERYTTERARSYYEILAPYGPNDGLLLLADAYIPGGVNYAVWGADHYFQGAAKETELFALFDYLLENQE